MAAVLIAWLAGTAAPQARADGRVMPPVLVPQEVAMPDQRALLAWRDGVETLVIESAFVGKGTDFAWVVPLPAKPEVEAATRGTLASAAALLQPVVKPPVNDLWWLAVGLPAVGLTALVAGWRWMGWLFRAGLFAGMGAVAGFALGLVMAATAGGLWKEDGYRVLAVLGALTALVAGRAAIRHEWSLFWHLIVLIGAGLLALFVIPTGGTMRSTMGPAVEAGGVTVERQIVGDFDVALVSGREGEGVAGWLRDNGYAITLEAEAVAKEHVAAGGWFVASRVRRGFAGSGRSVPAPLVFRFAAEQPVYPMRLTGAGAKTPLELELFVFGPERAVATGLKPVAWGPVQTGDLAQKLYRRGSGQPGDGRVMTHPTLLRLTAGAAVVTHLRGILTPSEMHGDIQPRWEAAEPAHGLTAWAREAVWQTALVAGGALVFVAAVIWGFRHDGRPPPRPRAAGVVALAAAAGGVALAWVPSVSTREAGEGKAIPRYAVRQVPQVAILALWELDPATTTDEAARAVFAAELKKFSDGQGWEMAIGDGPGQVELVKTPEGKWRTILYDAAGQAHYSLDEDFELGGGRSAGRTRE